MKGAQHDAHDGPPNDMQRKHNDIDAGLQAFKDALAPQEGQFMRGATWIMNEPKDLSGKPSRSPNPSQDLAEKLLERNAKGQFLPRDYSEVK